MARKLIVELVGDSRSLERTFVRGSHAARGFGRDVGRVERGVLAGSGAFRSLGRSVAFASASFLGGVGIVAAVKSTVTAAVKAEEVLTQTAVATRNAGESWKAYGKRIQEVALAESKLSGFEDERLLNTFSTLVRRTKNVNTALKLNALAADVARGRHISLEAATQLVLRASLGLSGALRRVGIDAKKGSTSAQLLTLLQRKYAGAAAAYGRTAAGAQERFRVAIENLQEAIGRGLLPTFTKLLNRASDWLNNTRNQQSIVKGLKRGISALGTAFQAAWALARPLVRVVSELAGKVGGWKTMLELAIGAWAGFKVAGVTSAIAVEVANVAAAAGTGAAWRAALIATGWGAFAIAAGAAAAYIVTHWQKVKLFFKVFWIDWQIYALKALRAVIGPFSHIPWKGGQWARDLKDQAKDAIGDLEQRSRHWSTVLSRMKGDAKKLKLPATPGGKVDNVIKPLTAAELKALNDPAQTATKKTWRDAWEQISKGMQVSLARAGLTKSLQDDLRVLRQMESAVRHQLSLHRNDLDLQQQLIDTVQQRRDLEQQIAENRRARIAGRQFRALGLTTSGEEPVPGTRALRGQLARVQGAIEGTFLDTKRTRTMISKIRRILAGGLGAVGRDVRQKIHEILGDFDRQLKDHAGEQTRFRKANVTTLLAGLGLSGDQLRAVQARVATIGPGGVVPAGRSVAFAGAGAVYTGPIHVHGVQNPREFEDHMNRRSRSRPKKRRGA